MKHGPLFMFALKRRLAVELGNKGKSAKEIRSLLTDVDSTLVENVCATMPQVTAAIAEFDKIGDGTIIQKLLDFMNSPAGQALLKALIALLIGMI